MKIIPLTRGRQTIIDDEDYDFLSRWTWTALLSNGRWYAVRHENNTAILMHRVLLKAPSISEVDHKDGNGLNNTRGNIRLCTHTQNMQNRDGWVRLRSKQPSRYKGVYWEGTTNRRGRTVERASPWCAQIVVNKKKIRSYHSDETKAAAWYDQMARRFFGDFARLNFTAVGVQ